LIGEAMSASKVAGSFAMWVALPWPWPVERPLILLHQTFEGASLSVRCDTCGHICVDVYRTDGIEAKLNTISCPTHAEEPPFVFIAGSFEFPDSLFILVNDTIVASTNSHHDIPDCFHIPKRKEQAGTPQEDFSGESATAIRRRRDRLAGTHRHPNRIPGDDAYVREQLENEAKQLRDLLDLIDRGAVHHAAGLAARLRLLIAAGGSQCRSCNWLRQWLMPLLLSTPVRGRAIQSRCRCHQPHSFLSKSVHILL